MRVPLLLVVVVIFLVSVVEIECRRRSYRRRHYARYHTIYGATQTCRLPSETGPCRASIERWYYDAESKECKTFIWGGCEGNANRFETKGQCEDSCNAKHSYVETCRLPSETGRCRAYFERWYYDAGAKECKTFIWGGCGGNANRFETKGLCKQHCSETCRLPSETGPCRAAFESWYYDAESKECKTFTWGGCGGNANRFETKGQCEDNCSGLLPNCSSAVCLIHCPFGKKKDEHGCDLCECRTLEEKCGQVQCTLHCPNGFSKDRRGCDVCKCRRATHWRRACARNLRDCTNECAFGRARDSSGCPTCTCSPRPVDVTDQPEI